VKDEEGRKPTDINPFDPLEPPPDEPKDFEPPGPEPKARRDPGTTRRVPGYTHKKSRQRAARLSKSEVDIDDKFHF
jgi:hypothetical protein